MSNFAAFGTQSNAQQNPAYQSQQSSFYDFLNGMNKPKDDDPKEEAPTAQIPEAPAASDKPFSVEGAPSPAKQTEASDSKPASQGGMAAPVQPTSPVNSNGSLSANPSTPWMAAPAAQPTVAPGLQYSGTGQAAAPQAPAPPLANPQQPGGYQSVWQQQLSTTNPPTNFTPGPMQAAPPGAQYNGYQWGAINQGPQYQPQQFAGQYNATQFGQFQGPNQQALDAQLTGNVQQMLANPDMISADQITAMKAAQQEQINARSGSAQQAMQSSVAGRGLSGSGGARMAGERRIESAGLNEMANAYRDIDLQSAQMNAQGRRQAMGLASDVMNAQMGRATQGYSAQLAGQQAQAGDNLNAAQFGLQAYGANQGERQFAQQAGMQNAQFGFAQQQARAQDQQAAAQSAAQNYQFGQQMGLNRDQLGMQGYFTQAGLNLDNRKTDLQNTQFNQGMGLDFMRFLESKYQGRQGLDLQRQQMGQQGQQFTDQMAFNYDRMSADRENSFYNFLQNGYR